MSAPPPFDGQPVPPRSRPDGPGPRPGFDPADPQRERQAIATAGLRRSLRRLGVLLAGLGGVGAAGIGMMALLGVPPTEEPAQTPVVLASMIGMLAIGVVLLVLGRERSGDARRLADAQTSDDPFVQMLLRSERRGRAGTRVGSIVFLVLGALNTLSGLAGILAFFGAIPALQDVAGPMLMGLVVGPILIVLAIAFLRVGAPPPSDSPSE